MSKHFKGCCIITWFWNSGQQEWKLEKKSSDIFTPDTEDDGNNGRIVSSASDLNVDEEAPLVPSSRISHIGRSQLSNRDA